MDRLLSRPVEDQAQIVRRAFSSAWAPQTECENWIERGDKTSQKMMSMSGAVDAAFPKVHFYLMIKEVPFLDHASHLLVLFQSPPPLVNKTILLTRNFIGLSITENA